MVAIWQGQCSIGPMIYSNTTDTQLFCPLQKGCHLLRGEEIGHFELSFLEERLTVLFSVGHSTQNCWASQSERKLQKGKKSIHLHNLLQSGINYCYGEYILFFLERLSYQKSWECPQKANRKCSLNMDILKLGHLLYPEHCPVPIQYRCVLFNLTPH